MDAGPVVSIEERTLTGDEQAPELLKELFDSGLEALLQVLNAVLIHNKLRAIAGRPGTWADFILGDGDDAEPFRLKIGKTVPLRREGRLLLVVRAVVLDCLRCNRQGRE
ncbi:hypothetical protein FGB62_325g011 [Gracilaria domingensis]|nr:hypothetical protein FGB62_325g011 [Gracilaria domingensis]